MTTSIISGLLAALAIAHPIHDDNLARASALPCAGVPSALVNLAELGADPWSTPSWSLPLGAGHTDLSRFFPTPRLGNECDSIAFVTLQTSLLEAGADYLLAVAKCINSGGGFLICLATLNGQYQEDVTLAQTQYAERIRVCGMVGNGRYNPQIDPSKFSTTINNTYFPLVPGRTLVYRKKCPEGIERIRVTTTSDTVEVEGVECVVVRDTVKLNGVVVEDTDDWYAQHDNGDLWYFGEIARNYEEGLLNNLGGSWKSGDDGARAGVLIKASPAPGDAYRQELLINTAEDIALVISTGETVTVPAGTFTNCIQTEDFSPLEPGKLARKFYAPGVGTVLEIDQPGGERTELVKIINP